MSGQLDFGLGLNNAGAARIGQAKAFSEGIYWRAQGTAAAYPITDNPQDGTGSEEEAAWDRGWTVANNAAASTISQSDAPGVAIPTHTILA